MLFPVAEQKYLAAHVDGGVYDHIDSVYGHDGFLLEFEKLTATIKRFYQMKSAQ
jgi:homoserine O-acetyltransferase